MRRLSLSWLICFGILAQFLAGFQNPSPPPQAPSYLVLLKKPSLVAQTMSRNPGATAEVRQRFWNDPEALNYQREVLERQQQLVDRFRSTRLREGKPNRMEVLGQRAFLLNMLLVRGVPDELQELALSEEVEGIYPNVRLYPLLDSAPMVVGAPAVWEALGGLDKAGLGIKIGIIDSGINHSHPMFEGDGLPPPETVAENEQGFNSANQPSFTNSKVIVARNYVKTSFGLRRQDNETPQDELGHGSQVAGIAAGTIVETPRGIIQGMAPLASLGNYKVFGNPGVNPNTTLAAVTAAIEDAVKDGMDIINLSLGGEARPLATDPEVRAIDMAAEAGVVVVAAAGNNGPDVNSITSPGTSPDAITVGATSNGRIFASALETSADTALAEELRQIPYVPGSGPTISESVGPLPLFPLALFDESELACWEPSASPLPPASLAGEIVLVRRGECVFSIKASNLFDAGAEGMVVYNNVAGGSVVMSGLNDFEQPAVMIGEEAGKGLRDLLLDGAQVEVILRAESEQLPFPAEPDIVASFSGRGPNIDLAIKPDLTAPGQNIHTASHQTDPQALFSLGVSGTSFATPMVSGAAALIMQLRPDWSQRLAAREWARAIKSVVVNTASKTPTWREQPARLIHTGNGRLDLTRALQASATLHPVSLSYGRVEENLSTRLEKKLEFTHLGNATQTFSIEVTDSIENSSAHISVSPARLSLSSGETAEITVSTDLIAPLVPGVFEGFVRITDLQEEMELTASYRGAVTVEDSSARIRVSQLDQSAHSSVAAAIESAQPGNVIEIGDSATYEESINIRHNADGLDLDGITLRPASGQTPVIDVSQQGGRSPAVTVSGLERVTVEGLQIRGGLNGISYEDSSGTIRHNTIEDTRAGSDPYAVRLSLSRAHVFENTIRNGRSGIGVFSSSALIQGNQIGDPQEDREDDGIGILLSGASRAGIFDNVITNLGTNRGQGIQLSSSAAVVKGNVISGIRGQQSDGIVASGQFSQLHGLDNRLEQSGRFGVSLRNGAEAILDRNHIVNSGDTGLHLEEGSQARVRSSRLIDNARGVHSQSSSVEMYDTLIAATGGTAEGDGIFSLQGTLQIHNNTIFGNSGVGIRVSGGEVSVSNTILDQNGGGDVSGVSVNSFVNNLIGDGTFDERNGNFAADPLFSDSSILDLSVQADSPAVDAGGDSPESSPVDLFSHQRILDGDGDGKARVDLGAIEFGSKFWTARILPVLSLANQEFVGLAMVNGSQDPAGVVLRHYSLDGELIGTFEAGTLAPGSQKALLLGEAFDSLQNGWIQILSDQPDLMSVTLLGNHGLTFLDGAALSPVTSGKLVFPEVRSGGGPGNTSLLDQSKHRWGHGDPELGKTR